jgi:hypothetical protein
MHVRYYVTKIVDVQLKRTQRSERLCAKDNKHHSATYETATLTIRRTFIQLKHVHSLKLFGGETGSRGLPLGIDGRCRGGVLGSG